MASRVAPTIPVTAAMPSALKYLATKKNQGDKGCGTNEDEENTFFKGLCARKEGISPHRGRGRNQPGQKVHVSAVYCQKSYSPKAVLPVDGTQWVDFIGLGDREDPLSVLRDLKDIDLLEMDIFDPNAADIAMKMTERSPDKTGPLHRLAIHRKLNTM
ncbi:hypothetical protein BU17DRAFT_71512 [Hysterangium stoloniferum]|nr:hypothetical protein BU17DRAFT_71512 [Hysterangium stoloniferum]